MKDFLSDRHPAAEPEVVIDSDDMATLMYTTGTESFPKGVVTTHLNYYMSMLHLACDCDFRREDVLVIDIPLFHVAGTTVLLASITFGSRAIIAYAPDPMNILRTTQEQKVTMWIYPPTLYHALAYCSRIRPIRSVLTKEMHLIWFRHGSRHSGKVENYQAGYSVAQLLGTD